MEYQNLMRKVTIEQINTIMSNYETKTNVHVIKIDGSKVKDEDSYNKVLKENLQTPYEPFLNSNAYLDIMRDPYSYYEKDEIVIFIYNYNEFLSDDIELKAFVEEKFKELILPFFEKEVERVFVGGVRTKYNVYYSL